MAIQSKEKRLLFIIRGITLFFIIALVLSGITAFPVETGLEMLGKYLGIPLETTPESYGGMEWWLAYVYKGISETNKAYPFLAYGYDWLAFAHLVIAVAFIGIYIKPVRNIWIVHFGMIACVGVIPLALICGHIRQIPFYWQLIDCSFGVFGIIPLYILHRYIKKLEKVIGYVPAKY